MRFFENLRKSVESSLMGFLYRFHEKFPPLKKGEFRMILRDSKTGEILEERTDHNIIVNSASILIARLLKDSHEPDGGITYLAVGTGGDWDLQNPPQPTNTATKLVSELTRKAFTTNDVSFIDPITGNPTIVPTNVVDFTCTFNETEAVGALVEMGLFGGDASDARDSGTMVNYRTFPVINKSNSMTLTIIFRITA